MKTSLPSGQAHGWGIAGKYLSNEISKLPFLDGVTLHAIAGTELRPMNQEQWNKINIGYCFFENDIETLHHTQRAAGEWDYIVAGSSWCEEKLKEGGVQQSATILQGIDPSNFHPLPYRPDDGRFVVFSGGKFEYRKGQDLVIAAMRVFMERHDDVFLVCSWFNAWPSLLATMAHSQYINFRYSNEDCLTILEQTLHENGIPLERSNLLPLIDNTLMHEIFQQTDIGLFPNRCEGGNNMVMCEYMACERTVIATDKTGHADVITQQNAFPLTQSRPVQFIVNGEPRGNWDEASPEEILEKLEFAYQNRNICRQKSIVAAANVKKLTWSKAAREFHALAEKITAAATCGKGLPHADKKISPQQAKTPFSKKDNQINFLSPSGKKKQLEGLKLFKQALDYHRAGNLKKALATYDRAISITPNQEQVHNNRAVALKLLGRTEEALAAMERACAINPGYAEAHNSRGVILKELGRNAEALTAFERAIIIDPGYADAHYNRANELVESGRYEEAIAAYDLVISIKPSFIRAHNNRGSILLKLGKSQEALEAFDRAIAINPAYAMAHNSRGGILHESGRYEEALAAFDRAIAINPSYTEAYSNQGTVLQSLKRYEDALAAFDRAISIDPAFAKAYYNRGVVLQAMERYDEALAALDRAIAVQPLNSPAFNNRGSILQLLGKYDDALVAHSRAIAISPDNSNAKWNKSLLLLLTGNYNEGWPLYESRWSIKDYAPLLRDFNRPLWLGNADIRGKTILLYHEQGFGDTIQMLRYIPLLAAQGARIILEVPDSLLDLVRDLPGVACAITRDEALPDYDLQCPFMSLPLAFKTTLDTIPSAVPYLRAHEGRIDAWKNRLGEKTLPRIGLVWSGKTSHQNDRNRSIEGKSLRRLLEKNVEFHSLQVEYREKDRELFNHGNNRLLDHAGEIAGFADTAALIESMDLVITVDTAVAHLACALGKPVWILLPYVPDFRWLINREDSPWYPTARLFRQQALNDWDSALELLMNTPL